MKQKITEKQLDKIQDRMEKIELKNIQKDYEKKTPFLVWLVKVGAILSILDAMFVIFLKNSDVTTLIQKFALIIIFAVGYYGIQNRKRWAWYLWLISPALYFASSVLYKEIFYLPAQIVIVIIAILIILWHKDYFNK